MVTNIIAQTLRIHGDFIKKIYGAVGGRPFTTGHLVTLGVDIPPGVSLKRFRNAGIFILVGRTTSHTAIWRLPPGVLDYCATQEATA